MSDREFYCDTCEGVQPFEAPPCADGHGTDCPELACTGCGAAMLIATFTFPATRLAGSPHRAPRRHAA
ncbi:hypothetical protein [Micromonospora sp. RTGN7]|uniref:hypothetical protein n=1 Tax=Micromonospora sp. RTGN7 TaxID=3016526 RepID=UPI0029FF4950|nr:hypothetical protein [Micromonospora sp. RTGN7]